MKLTYFEDKNYKSVFENNKNQMNLFSLVGDYLREKKRTLFICWYNRKISFYLFSMSTIKEFFNKVGC